MYSVNTTQNSLFLAEGSTVLKVQTRNLGCIFAALASSASASTWLPNDADFYLHDLLTPCHPCPDSSSVQFSSVVQSCPTLCDPMNCSTPGLPVHCQLPEFTQTHPSIQWCYPAISSSVIPFPQSLPASKSFPMSKLFAWGGQSTGVSASASFPPKNSHFLKNFINSVFFLILLLECNCFTVLCWFVVCVGFCTAMWISYEYTSIPPLLNFHPILPSLFICQWLQLIFMCEERLSFPVLLPDSQNVRPTMVSLVPNLSQWLASCVAKTNSVDLTPLKTSKYKHVF